MLSFAGLSRRALVAGALLAAPPVAARKRKHSSPPPEAFVAGRITQVQSVGSGQTPEFGWSFAGQVHHPASDVTAGFSSSARVPVDATTKQTRAAIEAAMRQGAQLALALEGQSGVPVDRMAIVLL
jgi:hypothetical protein